MIRITAALSTVLVLIICVGVDAATHYVSPAGNDIAGDGSTSNPWRTIQYTVDQAAPGDRIRVADDDDEGTDDYIENVTVDRSLTIEREDDTGANPQISARDASTHVFHVTADSVTIGGLDVYAAQGDTAAGIYLNRVRGCTIQENRLGWEVERGNAFGITLTSSSGNTLSGNTCSNNIWGILLIRSGANTISDNICRANRQMGIFLYDTSDTNRS